MTFSWNGDRISFRSLSLAWNLENMSSTPNHTRDDAHDVSQNLPMGIEQMTRLAVFGDFGPNFAALVLIPRTALRLACSQITTCWPKLEWFYVSTRHDHTT
jgi:hypothetical protein